MNLIALGPELIIITIAIGVIVVDMVIPEKAKDMLGYLSLSGLVGALAYAIIYWTSRGIVLNSLNIDELDVVMRATILLIGIMINLAAIKNNYTIQKNQGEFFSLMLFSISGSMILAGSKELITLYLGLELSTIPTFILVIFRKDKAKAGEAVIKYFILGLLSSIFLLYGMSLIYGLTGQVELAAIAKNLPAGKMPVILIVASILTIVGFGFKITTVPFHFWAPDTYEGAPLVVVAYIATILKLGAFAIIARFFVVALGATKANWPLWFGTVAIVTMTLGNLMALPQKSIKRMMAYSGIAHVGYPIIGLAIGTKAGISAMFFYMITYTISTVGIFFVMHARYSKTESDDIDSYRGMAQTNPILALVMTLCFLSLIGFPPLAGFFGKVYLIIATVQVHKTYLAVFLIVNSVISFGYYAKVIKAMYLQDPETEGERKKLEIPIPTVVSLGLATFLMIVTGMIPTILKYTDAIFKTVKF